MPAGARDKTVATPLCCHSLCDGQLAPLIIARGTSPRDSHEQELLDRTLEHVYPFREELKVTFRVSLSSRITGVSSARGQARGGAYVGRVSGVRMYLTLPF
jgi:hypothetical protein